MRGFPTRLLLPRPGVLLALLALPAVLVSGVALASRPSAGGGPGAADAQATTPQPSSPLTPRFVISFPRWDGTPPPAITGAAAAVLDGESGALLFGHEIHRRLPPASISKIVTAMIAIERGNLDAIVPVDIDGFAYARETDSSVVGLEIGDVVTLRDLLYGLILHSGNDAAIAIARHIAGSEPAFVALMNARVAQLGLRDTHFANPHGLHEPNHYSTAYDMAVIGRWAMGDARFREITSARSWRVAGPPAYTIRNANPLLGWYDGADGVKLGWHEDAGVTFVGSAVRGNRRLVVSLFDTRDLRTDAAALLDWAFAHWTRD